MALEDILKAQERLGTVSQIAGAYKNREIGSITERIAEYRTQCGENITPAEINALKTGLNSVYTKVELDEKIKDFSTYQGVLDMLRTYDAGNCLFMHSV